MKLRWWGLLLVAASMAGCGGGSDAPAGGPAIVGAVVKGPVSGATVCVYALSAGAKGAQIALSAATPCTTTGLDGSYMLVLPSTVTGDVLLESTGGAYCSDESQLSAADTCAAPATRVSLAGSVLSSLVGAPGANTMARVYVTPLTTAAVQNAGANLSTASFATQFGQLASQLLGAGNGLTPGTAPTPANQPFLAQIASFMANGGNLSSAVSTLAQGSTVFGPASTGGTVAATVNSALVGSRTLTFRVGSGSGCGSVCSYQEDQQVNVVIGADNSLTVGALQLRNPYFRTFGGTAHTPEIIWLDAASGVEYALTNNDSGQFSEINVGDSALAQANGIPGFVGQLRPASTGAAAAIARVAGTYALGAQYRGADVAWSSVTVGADGAITFNGGTGPDVSTAAIVGLVDYTGCCGRVDITVNFELDANAGLTAGDKVSLLFDAAGGLRSIEYPAGTASVQDDVGVILGTPDPLPVHSGATPTRTGLSMTAGGSALQADQGVLFNGRAVSGFSLFANTTVVGAGASIQLLRAVTLGATYACKDSGSNKVVLVAQPNAGTIYSSDFGGRCSITVTALETDGSGKITEIAGIFVAELHTFRQDGTPLVINDGVFRYRIP